MKKNIKATLKLQSDKNFSVMVDEYEKNKRYVLCNQFLQEIENTIGKYKHKLTFTEVSGVLSYIISVLNTTIVYEGEGVENNGDMGFVQVKRAKRTRQTKAVRRGKTKARSTKRSKTGVRPNKKGQNKRAVKSRG